MLCQNKNEVTLWAHEAEQVREMQKTRCNQMFLPGIPIAEDMRFDSDLARSVEHCECAVLAVPSKFFRAVTSRIPQFSGIAVSVTKGIEYETGLTMSGVLKNTMPRATAAALSGPTLAMEVAREHSGGHRRGPPGPASCRPNSDFVSSANLSRLHQHRRAGRRIGWRAEKHLGHRRGHGRRAGIRRQRQGRP